MSPRPEPFEIPQVEEEDGFSRVAAVAIVVTTLLAALAGFLEARASRGAAQANVRAQRAMADAIGGTMRAEVGARTDFSIFATAERQRHEAGNAFQRAIFATNEEALGLDLESRRFDDLAAGTQELTSLELGSPEAPAQDPIFPFRFFVQQQREADRLWALANAANEEDAGWESQEAGYTAVLTVFAVAVTLLGLSLTIRQRSRLVLAGVAAVLAWSGFAVGIWMVAHPPRGAPAGAADAYAEGRQAVLLALDPEDFGSARDAFTRAVELRPTFAEAYLERGAATYFAAQPEGAVFGNPATPEAVVSASDDIARALELGLDTRSVHQSLGVLHFQQGLNGATEMFEESIAQTEYALQLDPDYAPLYFQLGVAFLAEGREEEARSAYGEAVLHTLYTDVNERVERPYGLGLYWLSDALTTLEALREAQPDRGEDVLTMKEFVMGSLVRGEPGDPVGTAPPMSELDVRPDPDDAIWEAELPALGDGDSVSVQWYHREPGGWAVVPDVSGERTLGQSGGLYYQNESLLQRSFPPACLPDGEYMVELYINGHLAGVGEGSADFGTEDATVFRDLNVAMCRPSGWETFEHVPGFIEGARSPDGSEGVIVLRLQDPPDDMIGGWTRGGATDLIDAALDVVAELLPAPAAYDSAATNDFFMYLDRPLNLFYRFGATGQILSGAGIAPDGSVIVGAVFGPEEEFDGGRLTRVFESLNQYN